jgi:branched-chain amino acid transport system permease protein
MKGLERGALTMALGGRAALVRKIILAAIVVLLIALPLWATQGMVNVFLLIMLYMAVGEMWNLLAGYAGLVSLGQQIFIGLGGYSLAVFTEVYHLNFLFAIFIGGVVSGVFALVISQPIFKMKGIYFAIGSWIVAEAVALYFLNWSFVRYGLGFNIRTTYDMTTNYLYYISLVVGLGSVLLVYLIMRTKGGLALMAMRDNELAAEVMGIGIYKTKLMIFLVSAFVTGVAGGVLYLNISFIQPTAAFSIQWTVAAVVIVIIGGIGTMEGPIIGAVIYVVLQQYLYDFPGFSMIILGVIAITIILVAPRGIMGTLHEKFGWEVLSARRNPRALKAAASSD